MTHIRKRLPKLASVGEGIAPSLIPDQATGW